MKLTIEEMQEIANKRGGACLSKKYVNNKIKLKWQCSKGHIWEADPYHVKNRQTWCPECAGLKKCTIGQMKAIAKSKGGKCLAKKYVNDRTKLKWQCNKGHVWEAIPNAIKRNNWCPECYGNKRLSIELMQAIAKQRGGKCLSKEYVLVEF